MTLYEARFNPIGSGTDVTFPVIDETGAVRTFTDALECYRFAVRNSSLHNPVVIWKFNARTGERIGTWRQVERAA